MNYERRVITINRYSRKKRRGPFDNIEVNDFYCPHCFESKGEDESFCSSLMCPEGIPQPEIPSANSTLSPEELERLEQCISAANELLLSIGVERDEENFRSLQKDLLKLKNQFVCVTVNCNEEEGKTLNGLFLNAGLNFILLKSDIGNLLVIPFERLLFLEQANLLNRMNNQEQELLNINDCLRRNLTLHFSEVVSKSPFLINLFYGLELKLFLTSYLDCFVYVKVDNEVMEKDGLLLNVNDRRVELEIDNETQGIDFDELCFIEIEQEAITKNALLCNSTPIIT